jgi:HSP20-like domain found in ArsA
MAVIRFDPFRDPLERLLSMAATGTRAPLGMPMDVYRAGDGSYHVEADLPGVDPDSVEVTVEHSTLTIRAERTPALRGQRAGHRRRAAAGVIHPAAVPRRGRDLGEPHRQLRRRCPARDHLPLAEDPGPPGPDHPCARRPPHHLREHG